MIEFLGKLHPILVHLPIGMIIIAILIEWFCIFSANQVIKESSRFIFTVALICSMTSLISGYWLSLENANDQSSVDLHKWLAIVTTIILFIHIVSWHHIQKIRWLHHSALFLLLAMISATGHLGGELTHGKGYLSFQASTTIKNLPPTPPLENIESANVYTDVTKYIIQEKCQHCHDEEKQKGKLRLDNIDAIFKGGKSGKTIDLNDLKNSEFLKRILMNEDEDHHMPPKKEKQLTLNEVKILEWWISNKCNSTKKFSDFEMDSIFRINLIGYQKERNAQKIHASLDRIEVHAISNTKKSMLSNVGLIVSEVSKNDNHIRVTGFNLVKPIKDILPQLSELKDQLIELKLQNTGLTDNDLKFISTLSSLEKLWIGNNQLSDQGLNYIGNLKHLRYLNLSGTKITSKGIQHIIKTNQSLSEIIAYDIQFSESEKHNLKHEFSGKFMSIGKDTMDNFISDTLFRK